MNDTGILVGIARGLLFLFAFFGLLVVPFAGGCVLIFALDRNSEFALPLGAAMALSIIGNIVLLRFVVTGDPPGRVAKTIMALLAVLDLVVAVVAVGQASARESGPMIIAAIALAKGITTLIFAFAPRPDDPPTFPTLRP
jgi:hypothetical protein